MRELKLVDGGKVGKIERVPTTITTKECLGRAVDRVGRMLEGGVDEEVIALQMTRQSEKTGCRQVYTVSDVETCGKMFRDASAGCILMTSQQADVLIRDSAENTTQEQDTPSEKDM